MSGVVRPLIEPEGLEVEAATLEGAYDADEQMDADEIEAVGEVA